MVWFTKHRTDRLLSMTQKKKRVKENEPKNGIKNSNRQHNNSLKIIMKMNIMQGDPYDAHAFHFLNTNKSAHQIHAIDRNREREKKTEWN